MGATITKTQVARKNYRCGTCLGTIQRGELYERTASTPKDEMYNTGCWDHLFAHAPYGVCLNRGMNASPQEA